MHALAGKVIARIEALEQDLIELTRALIAFPSLFGQERAAQEFYADRLASLGGSVDMWEPEIEKLKEHPAFISSRKDFSGSPVLAARFPGTGGGRSLLLCGHMDVVPPGDGDWSVDPWEGDFRAGRIYGRGAADMKGGLAASLIALQALNECQIKLQGDVLSATTVDEECGSTGVLAIVERGYRADAGLIPEPTGMELNIASTGSIWFKIRVQGKAAHAGMAYRGVSAIDKAMIVIQALAKLQEERRIRLMHPLYADLPVPFCLNVNTIHAGTWPAVVPPEAVMEGRMGVSPDESIEEARRELEEALARCAAGDRWLAEHPPQVEYMPCRWNSGAVSEDHPFSQILKHAVEDICSGPAKISGMGPCSDSGTLIRFAGIPTINFGPHSMSMAHQTDEFVDVGSLLATAKVLALTMLSWCGVADDTGGDNG